ncbi:MAG: response regulator [Leptolinea sp.]|nr:response regulator [Leptolinea sp.]
MKKILIVEDNPQNLYMLEVLLQSNGYIVLKATNGQDGLDLAAANPPDMVISDILMPTMDGFALCQAWNTSETLKHIPFIFYTATYTDEKDEAFALSLGAARFLVKPMEPDELLKILEEVLSESKTRSEQETTAPVRSPEEYYKTYSETLVRKLEEKMLQLERANKLLAALYQASCELTTVKPSIDMIQNVLLTITETAGYQQANFFSYDPTTKSLPLTSSAGFSEGTSTIYKDRLIFKLGEETGLVGLVAQTGTVINIGDTTTDPRWIILDSSIKSALFIPVFFEKKLLGVAALCSKEKNAFNEHDEQDISALSNSLAIAIENKRNQEHVEKQLHRLEAIHSIDMAINGNMELREILNAILKFIIEQLDIDAADVIRFNGYSLSFEYACGNGFKARSVDPAELRSRITLAEKAIMERRLVHISSTTEIGLPAGFLTMWQKEGFKEYWGIPLLARAEVKGVLEVFCRDTFEPDPEWLAYLETLAGQLSIAIDSSEMVEGLQKTNIDLRIAYDATIEGWSRALDLRDNDTEDHTRRVVEMTLKLAEAMGIKDEELIHIKRGALLHDIGKVGVPDQILHKPGPLTDDEWVIMRKHPQFAYEMLSPIGYLHRALDIPSCHHEKWDGTGYPRGLRGEQIPFAARLFAIVDVWDALRSDRPYRKAWSDDRVLEFIQTESGRHFDPKIVNAFLELLAKSSSL